MPAPKNYVDFITEIAVLVKHLQSEWTANYRQTKREKQLRSNLKNAKNEHDCKYQQV